MLGFVTELEKDYIFRLDFDRPWKKVTKVKKGKVKVTLTLANGDTVGYPVDTGCQYRSPAEQAGMIATKEEED